MAGMTSRQRVVTALQHREPDRVPLGIWMTIDAYKQLRRYLGLEATVELEHQRVVLHLPEELAFHFDIEPGVKDHLIHGLDDIGLTLDQTDAITRFESRHNPQRFGTA